MKKSVKIYAFDYFAWPKEKKNVAKSQKCEPLSYFQSKPGPKNIPEVVPFNSNFRQMNSPKLNYEYLTDVCPILIIMYCSKFISMVCITKYIQLRGPNTETKDFEWKLRPEKSDLYETDFKRSFQKNVNYNIFLKCVSLFLRILYNLPTTFKTGLYDLNFHHFYY